MASQRTSRPVYLSVPEVRRRRRRRWPHIVVWGARLAVFGMLAGALGLATMGAAHGILKQLGRGGQPQVIPVTLTPTVIDPAVILLARPGSVRFFVRNSGPAAQQLSVHGPDVTAQTDELQPGADATLDVTFARPGTYTLSAGSSGTNTPTGILTVQP